VFLMAAWDDPGSNHRSQPSVTATFATGRYPSAIVAVDASSTTPNNLSGNLCAVDASKNITDSALGGTDLTYDRRSLG